MKIKYFKRAIIIISLCLTASIYADTTAKVKLENDSRKPVYIIINRLSDMPAYQRGLESIKQKVNSVPSQVKGVFTITAKPDQSIYIYGVRNEVEVCRPENFSYPLLVHQGSVSDQEKGKVIKISLKVKKSKSKNACKVKLN